MLSKGTRLKTFPHKSGGCVLVMSGEEREGPVSICGAAVVEASDALAEEAALRLARLGCPTFVFFGPNARSLEDRVDSVLESKSARLGRECADVTVVERSLSAALEFVLTAMPPKAGDILVLLRSDQTQSVSRALARIATES